MDNQDKLITYLWNTPTESIEMRGVFTQSRWEQFCKKPHPAYNYVTITKVKEENYVKLK